VIEQRDDKQRDASPTRAIAILAAALTVAAVSVPAAAAPPESTVEAPSVEPISVHIEIVADTLSNTMRTKVTAEVEQQFADIAPAHGLVQAESPAAELVIRLEFTQPDPKVGVFVTHALAVYSGDVLQRDEARTCVQCTASEVAADGLKILVPAADLVEARRAEAAAQRQAELDAAEPPPPVVDAPPRSAVRHRIGPVGYVGISSSAIGLGTAIAGAVLLNRGSVPTSTDATFISVINYRPAGQALAGVGLGLMVVGNVLLAVDLGIFAPRRESRARVKIAGVTVVAEHGPGVVVNGRF
jgi:hypothetical protein